MNPELKNKIDKRQEANREIANAILLQIEQNPQLRFHQILHILKINEVKTIEYGPDTVGDPFEVVGVDHFNEESVDTLVRMNTKSAYELGYDAGHKDKSPDPPYEDGSSESRAWWNGYKDGSRNN